MISTNWGSATDVGLLREHNEDSFLAQYPVFMVADGMGGRAAGEVASGLTSVRFRELVGAGNITAEQVNQALVDANDQILDQSSTNDGLGGMGTTAVGLVHVNDGPQDLWLVFNVGDSRLYRWHSGVLEQVTIDHTEVQELVEIGEITSIEAHVHPLRHVITRAVGTDDTVEADIWLLPPVPGERFLLCSDGLTGEVSDQEIAGVLEDEGDPSLAATRLVERAVAAGGHDNVTVIVVDVGDDLDDDAEEFETTAPGRSGAVSDAGVGRTGKLVEEADSEMILNVPQSIIQRSDVSPAVDSANPLLIAEVPSKTGIEDNGSKAPSADGGDTDGNLGPVGDD